MKIHFCTKLEGALPALKDGFQKDLFLKLTPPWANIQLLRFDGCKKGDEIHLRIKVLWGRQSWVSLVTEEEKKEDSWMFVDEGKVLPWPLKRWRHVHSINALSNSSAEIVDNISFDCHWPWLGPLVYPVLWATFAIRPARYRAYFKELA